MPLLVERLLSTATDKEIIVTVHIILRVQHLAGERVGLYDIHNRIQVISIVGIHMIAVATLLVEPPARHIEVVAPPHLQVGIVHTLDHLIACIGNGQQFQQ